MCLSNVKFGGAGRTDKNDNMSTAALNVGILQMCPPAVLVTCKKRNHEFERPSAYLLCYAIYVITDVCVYDVFGHHDSVELPFDPDSRCAKY